MTMHPPRRHPLRPGPSRPRLLLTLGSASILALVLGSATGDAWADEKIYAPQFCVAPEVFAGEPGAAPPELSPAELRQNSGPGYQTFICPLVRDKVTSKPQVVWVRLINRNVADGDAPSCCVHAVSLGGSFSDFECRTAGNSSGATSLAIPLFALNQYDYGHYALSCSLGNGDGIISIRAQE